MEKILGAITNKDTSGIIIFRTGGTVCYSNEIIQNLFGYSETELASNNFGQLFHPEDAEQITVDWANVLKGKSDRSTRKNRLISKDGNVIKADVTISRQNDEHGKELSLFIIENFEGLDETLKSSSGDDFQQILADLKVVNTTGILIGEVLSGRYVYANTFLQKKLGYTKLELENIKPNDFVHPDDYPTMKKNGIKIVLGFKKEAKFKGRYYCKDGTVIEADHTETKHKSKKTKKAYLILLLDNIQVLATA